jgi:hypothetical protein
LSRGFIDAEYGLLSLGVSSNSPRRGLVQSEFAGIRKLLERFEDEAGTSNFWTHVYPAQKRLVLACWYSL